MTNATRKVRVPGQMRVVLAENVSRRMEERYWNSRNKPMALAKEAGVSLSTVQRLLSKEQATTIDTIEAVAGVFGLQAFQLLAPWGVLWNQAVPQRTAAAGARSGSRPLAAGRERFVPPVQRDSRKHRRTG